MKEYIDKTDSKIINFLQVDGRMPYTQIAKNLDLSEATVRTRVQKLIDNKVIQIVAVGDPLKLGFSVAGNIKLQANVRKIGSIITELAKINEIWYIALATGSEDIDLDFHVRNIEDLKYLLFDKIAKIDGVIKTESSIIIRYEKRKYNWGTSLDP